MTEHHHPLDQQQGATRAPAAPPSPVTNPATGEVTGEVALGQRRGRPRGDRRRRRGVPRVAGHLAGQAHRDPVQLPRAAQRPQGRAGRDHHRRARQGGLRRARRGQPRPGGRRIRLRYPASAQGRLHRERLDQGRRLLDPPAARPGRASSARSTSPPWCRCGSSPSPSPPATPSCSSRREKDPSASLWMAELWAEAGLPPGVFNVLQGDKTAVDELLTNTAIKSVQLRRLHPDRPVRLRKPAPRTASASRPWAAPRTTR